MGKRTLILIVIVLLLGLAWCLALLFSGHADKAENAATVYAGAGGSLFVLWILFGDTSK